MLTKKSLTYTLLRIALFVLLPVSISIFMFARIGSNIRIIMEDEMAKNASYQSALVSHRTKENLKYMQIISEYFCDERVLEENMEQTLSYLIEPEQLPKSGILRFDGSAVCGRELPSAKYNAVRKSFRGTSSVMYSRDEGLLFTVPIYNKKNIKYVLYEFFDERDLFGPEYIDFCEGQAQFALADSEQQSVSAFTGSDDISFYYEDEYRHVVMELDKKLGLHKSAAVYNVRNGEKELCFVSVTDINNLYLVGRVPYETVAGSAQSLYYMVITVSIFLLALLSIGTVNIVFVSRKVRESDELRKAKAAAESANKAKGEFIASMSHELRTPINVILGMNEMILREEASTVTKEHAMDIKSAAQILLSLINDVLDYTKIESGKMNIICAEYSLVTLVKDLALLTENRAYQKSIEFELDIDPDLPVGLFGDDIRIRQVLTNLLTNAVKYTAEGRVTLKITGKPGDNEDEITLRCEVKDTGIGIKKEDIDKLLVPYMRIEEERNRNVEGTGLGMPIIVNLLMLMGSMLNVESVYGAGSTFWFEIDQRVVDTEKVGDIQKRIGDMVKEYNYRVSFVAPKAKVLVVDDNSMNRQIFVSLLSKTKINISTASSGMKCLEMVKKEHFDMIFMDYLMPEMNGIETLHALRDLEGNLCKDSPVIALTANAFSGDREKYMSYGFDDFLSKPIVTEKLEALIMQMLPQEYVSTTTEEITEEAPAENLETELPEVEGVNLGIAKMYLKDSGLVLESLREYYVRLKNDMEELPLLYSAVSSDEGLASYRISVHALKSSSAVVGVMTVSELARVLEYASRDGDRDRIHAVHPILMEEIQRMSGRLEPYKPKKEEKARSENLSGLADNLRELRTMMDNMDLDSAEELVSEINSYSYGEDIDELIEKLGDDINFMDFESAEALLSKVLAIIEGK